MKNILLTTMVAASLAVSAQAAVLLEWTSINGNGSNNLYANIGEAGDNGAVGIVDSGLEATSGNMTRGGSFAQSFFGWSVNRLNTQAGANPTDLSGAITGSQYVAFTLAPGDGQQFSLNSATYYVHSQDNNVVGELLFSTNGFSSYTSLGSVTNVSGGMNGTTGTLDLTGFSALQNSTADTEFRIYFYGNGAFQLRGLGASEGSTPVFSLDGIVTPVPEPSTWALLAGGLTAFFMRRPRKVNGL